MQESSNLYLCIAEIKLDDSFPDSQFKINGYQFPLLRGDRDHKGVEKIVFVKEGLIVYRLKQLENKISQFSISNNK